jgi:hypothetical protein
MIVCMSLGCGKSNLYDYGFARIASQGCSTPNAGRRGKGIFVMREYESMNQEGGAQTDRTTSGRLEVPSESKISQERRAQQDPRVVTHMPDLGMRVQSNETESQDEFHPFRSSMKRRPLPSLRGKYLLGCLLVGSFVIVWGLSQIFNESDAEKDANARAERNRETVTEHGELPAYTPPTEADAPEMSSMSPDFPVGTYPDSFSTDTSFESSNAPWDTPYSGSPDTIPLYGSPAPTPYDATPNPAIATGYDAYGYPITPPNGMSTPGEYENGYNAVNPQYTDGGQAAPAHLAPTPPYEAQPQYNYNAEPQYGQGTPYATDPIYASEANPTPWNASEPSIPAPVNWNSSNAWGTQPNPAPQIVEQPQPQGYPPVAQPGPIQNRPQSWEQNASLELPPQGMTVPQNNPMTVPQYQYQAPTQQMVADGRGAGYPPREQQPSPHTNTAMNQPTQPNYAMTGGAATDAWNQSYAQSQQPMQQQPTQMQPPQQQSWAPPQPTRQQTPIYPEGPIAAPPRRDIAMDIPGMPADRGVEYTANLSAQPYPAPGPATPPVNPNMNPNPNGYQYQPQPGSYYPPSGGAVPPTAGGQMQPTYR